MVSRFSKVRRVLYTLTTNNKNEYSLVYSSTFPQYPCSYSEGPRSDRIRQRGLSGRWRGKIRASPTSQHLSEDNVSSISQPKDNFTHLNLIMKLYKLSGTSTDCRSEGVRYSSRLLSESSCWDSQDTLLKSKSVSCSNLATYYVNRRGIMGWW